MSNKFLATPKPAPELSIPQSDKFVKVSVIDRYVTDCHFLPICKGMSRVAIKMHSSIQMVDEPIES
jgi:hypothetical protein